MGWKAEPKPEPTRNYSTHTQPKLGYIIYKSTSGLKSVINLERPF